MTEAKLTRSMKYQVLYEGKYHLHYAEVKNLLTGTRLALYAGEAYDLNQAITALEAIDARHIGSKPSAQFCEAFDKLCVERWPLDVGHPGDGWPKEIPGVPYPFCRHPDKCRGTGRCQHDPVCND